MWSVLLCLCLCLSLYGREVTVGYARLRGGMGATFCHLAALRSAIEFLLGSLGNGRFGPNPRREGGHGRSREQISAIWRPLGRRLNFSSGIIGKRPFWAKSGPGGHGRSREVTGGYGRLWAVTEGENGGKWRNGRKKVGENHRK